MQAECPVTCGTCGFDDDPGMQLLFVMYWSIILLAVNLISNLLWGWAHACIGVASTLDICILVTHKSFKFNYIHLKSTLFLRVYLVVYSIV